MGKKRQIEKKASVRDVNDEFASLAGPAAVEELPTDMLFFVDKKGAWGRACLGRAGAAPHGHAGARRTRYRTPAAPAEERQHRAAQGQDRHEHQRRAGHQARGRQGAVPARPGTTARAAAQRNSMASLSPARKAGFPAAAARPRRRRPAGRRLVRSGDRCARSVCRTREMRRQGPARSLGRDDVQPPRRRSTSTSSLRRAAWCPSQ